MLSSVSEYLGMHTVLSDAHCRVDVGSKYLRVNLACRKDVLLHHMYQVYSLIDRESVVNLGERDCTEACTPN